VTPRKNLAFRNLLRANMVKLATGQQMVTIRLSFHPDGATTPSLTIDLLDTLND
jgi:hypothetical protein